MDVGCEGLREEVGYRKPKSLDSKQDYCENKMLPPKNSLLFQEAKFIQQRDRSTVSSTQICYKNKEGNLQEILHFGGLLSKLHYHSPPPLFLCEQERRMR